MLESEQVYQPTIYYVRTRIHTSAISIGGGYVDGQTLSLLIEKQGVILWENQGLFLIIPTIILANIWELWNASQIIQEHYPRTSLPLAVITWDQGLPLSPGVANGLLAACEKYNSLSNTGGT